jgi:hypothetical protein|tara:strand:- start:3153 stop:3422 length:270 start_codon:yes stop_codon:yes gene_type:complete
MKEAKKALKENNIYANVLTRWNNLRCKFLPGELAKPRGRKQQVGEVIAVSTVDGKHIRSENRGHTRYFLQFRDGSVRGYLSSDLNIANA